MCLCNMYNNMYDEDDDDDNDDDDDDCNVQLAYTPHAM